MLMLDDHDDDGKEKGADISFLLPRAQPPAKSPLPRTPYHACRSYPITVLLIGL